MGHIGNIDIYILYYTLYLYIYIYIYNLQYFLPFVDMFHILVYILGGLEAPQYPKNHGARHSSIFPKFQHRDFYGDPRSRDFYIPTGSRATQGPALRRVRGDFLQAGVDAEGRGLAGRVT